MNTYAKLSYNRILLTDSTNNEIFTVPMSVLVDSIYGDQHNTIPLPGGIQAAAPTTPLPMTMLDSLTVHAKMRYSNLSAFILQP